MLQTLREPHIVKYLKIIAGVLLALLISLLLTFAFIIYYPPVFKKALSLGFEMLPKHEFVRHEIMTKEQLSASLGIDPSIEANEDRFEAVRGQWPKTKDKSLFFAYMMGVHQVPSRCSFSLIGFHKTMNVAWRLEGLYCKDKKSCKLAYEEQVCRLPKKLERHLEKDDK